ncbi:hypothetical protein GS429_06840 [Natronorubrum sp. JWXQ-INN-674]|uniref:Uncharacterized protein n=1 Tax=Natronorubrum halalkaliphilum TaxID=2691917 RepID=A0A6B0VKZ5_9EURY|nr:hypothetical protein [Natronorubrum halalkaliphilum]MXV61785.1 hypothetical protein [Natronorubrum halalkaliphilum]
MAVNASIVDTIEPRRDVSRIAVSDSGSGGTDAGDRATATRRPTGGTVVGLETAPGLDVPAVDELETAARTNAMYPAITIVDAAGADGATGTVENSTTQNATDGVVV